MPASPRVHVGIDCVDPTSLAPFWAAALGYEVGEAIPGGTYQFLVPPDDARPAVYLQRVPEDKVVKNRVHLDLRTAEAPELIERLLGLGASCIGQRQSGSTCAWWQVMSDPVGNEFCVCFEPDAQAAP